MNVTTSVLYFLFICTLFLAHTGRADEVSQETTVRISGKNRPIAVAHFAAMLESTKKEHPELVYTRTLYDGSTQYFLKTLRGTDMSGISEGKEPNALNTTVYCSVHPEEPSESWCQLRLTE